MTELISLSEFLKSYGVPTMNLQPLILSIRGEDSPLLITGLGMHAEADLGELAFLIDRAARAAVREFEQREASDVVA